MAREQIRLQYGKFNGDEHWAFDVEILGSDEHGLWLGGRKGSVGSRPGKSVKATSNYVTLIPANEGWWVATFNATPQGSNADISVYVDITTPTTVNEGEAFTLDLDLDVVQRADGRVEIVDEDEFADHQVEMSYPPRVITAAREAADSVKQMMGTGAAPFDGSHRAWLERI